MPEYICPLCGQSYISPRAMMECELRCEKEDRDSRR